MSVLAPTLQRFFTERLVRQRQASPATVASYRDSFRLLLGYVANKTGRPRAPSASKTSTPPSPAFLCHLEDDRHNRARSRNNRLAAIRALFHYAAVCHPEHAAVIARVLAIPQKRHDKTIVAFLTSDEADTLVAAPDPAAGKDDGTGPSSPSPSRPGCASPNSPASTAVTSLSAPGPTWHAQARAESSEPCRSPPTPSPCCAPGRANARTPRRPVVPDPHRPPAQPRRHRTTSHPPHHHRRPTCPSLHARAHPPRPAAHRRDGAAQAGVDVAVIALWLGHEDIRSTQVYLHADFAIKERALAPTAPNGAPPGRYRPSDPLLAFLESL